MRLHRLTVAVRSLVPTVILGMVAFSASPAAFADDPLLAENDLPGIPISITQGARRELLSPSNGGANDTVRAERQTVSTAAQESEPVSDAPAQQILSPDLPEPAMAPPRNDDIGIAGVDPDAPIVDPDTGRVNLELLRQRYEGSRPATQTVTPPQPAVSTVEQTEEATVSEENGLMSRMEPGMSELDIPNRAPERPSMLDEDLSRIGAQLAQSVAKTVQPRTSAPTPSNQKPKGPTTLTLIPGVNQLATISRGHPNRVVTPFTNPEIRTTATGAEISTADSVVYVATDQEGPVTLYISERGQPRLAASLTLVPQPIPPQEIVFNFTDDIARDFKIANPRAEDWETRQPYVDTIVDLFRTLATQDLPSGYSLRKPHGSDVITCFGGQHVAFELGQVVEGHNIEVQILRATNVSDVTVEVIGHQCSGNAVMAAAEWPHSILSPGQSTEMYVAKHRLERITPEIRRPSLIGDRP
ncbi:TraK domain-containing protein [Marinobacter goseongensis]|uniref:TraK domain-containing protein n=1 Tax=Marinobacter goseongensis TaxID=453838 RepID=UPI0020041715|nr:type-F conjugative transfer system secretin TraK [Marinobacter goseongensis]MCK7553388.1 type-F conjugative transfer system secretin TraK [Marinobacter goseongensis]